MRICIIVLATEMRLSTVQPSQPEMRRGIQGVFSPLQQEVLLLPLSLSLHKVYPLLQTEYLDTRVTSDHSALLSHSHVLCGVIDGDCPKITLFAAGRESTGKVARMRPHY